MNSKTAPSGKNDEDMGRVELLDELRRLRDLSARQQRVLARYGLPSGDNGYPEELLDHLEAQRERIDALKNELRYRHEDIESQREQLAARLEELCLSLERQAKMENAVIRSERDFRAVVTKNADAMVILDADGRVRYANPAAESLFGMPATEMAGKLFGFPIVPHEPIEMYILREFQAFVAVEMRLVEVTWNDRPSYLISLRDMTDRIMAEQALMRTKVELEEEYRESKERYRVISEAAFEGIAIHEGGRIVDSNGAYARMFGYKQSELIGKRLIELSAPGSRGKVRKRIALGSDEPYEITALRKDGSTFLAEIRGGNTTYRGKPARAGSIRDITERKRVEESFRESEARYRELVENANSIILRLDRDGNVTFINEFAQWFFGYSGDELAGRNVLGTIVPAIDSAGNDLAGMMEDLLWHPEDYRTNINENMRKSGELVWVSWTNKAIYDEKGNVAGILCIGNDITRLKRAERAMEDARMQAELYLDLMGHDINNMHQIALGYLELAREMMPADESQMEYLDKPIEVLQRSARLISNVRKMQKLREGFYRTRTMDVREVLADVQREYGAIPHKPVKLNVNADDCYVRANELLFDVFANLVTNAIKHTGDRANIFVSLERTEEKGKGYCRVSVDDDGPGVPDDFKKVIFNRMLKSTAKAKGMGLGLFLVKSLVDSYGGRVWVEDRVKGDYTQGARFVVMLPVIG